ncbi:hypothetical protein GCM10025883_22590 [Mobilicoccus caccae]|uniref:Uncharacterized protein n=1 Tax=Mobilicoccus caccae TaxID=1859295 RepID=A0ABQ6IU12_9MICO|nr:hypothetical protein GCM10025883_22590 [Mobilicoccus caccae]
MPSVDPITMEPMTTPSVRDAFVDGAIAYIDGVPAHHTPHRAPTPEGIAWCNGWHAAQHDRALGLRRRRSVLKHRRRLTASSAAR